MKNRVIFIEPTSDNANVFDSYMRLPLMGTLYLGTILHDNGYEVRILNENILGRHVDPFELEADFFCLSCLTTSATRGRQLARDLRELYPEAKIIIGGMHASLVPEDFLDVADHLVTGEAEGVILDLIRGKHTEKVVPGSPVEDMDALPLVNYGLLENRDAMPIIPIMTSRGCPFDCNFCSVTKVFGKRFRDQSPERVLREIKNALSYFKTRDMFFYDDNLTANRRRAEELFALMAKADLGIFWSAQVRSDLARQPELLKMMRKAGCSRVYVGFESIQDETLKAYHKGQSRADIESAIRTFHDYGINIHGMFMFGDDHDTLETVEDTVCFAIAHEIDTVQFMILTPLPATQVYRRLKDEGRLYHENWSYYNGMYIVFRPKNMNPVALQEAVARAYRRFYSLRRTLADSLRLAYMVLVDALVLNLGRTYRYDLTTLFVRVGAKFIVKRYIGTNNGYLKFLEHTVRHGERPE